MAIVARENEDVDSVLRRFKKYVETESILKDYKEKQYYQKPSAKRRLKRKEQERKMRMKNGKKERDTYSR